ncbi:low-temperature-induced 65 kDa protein [Capsicum annuum]|uniref:low-temperature-induced 65 kDa protein n=1 Tax=Capsicum annuum TaxID=4072 RepID=UPI001FB0D7C3|nr:low-temperature-induced 65 kDa protein [Capsicum annuum]
MEAQLHRPQDTGLHSGEGQGQVHDEGEHHHKQSVLKKVKAKAKKIKDHLKHGLGHEHGHEHEQEHHRLQGGEEEEEEEETDDEEMEEGAEVHGGPYAIRSKDIRKEDVVPMANLENPTSPKEDRYDSKMKNEEVHSPVLQRQDEFARQPFTETHETKGGTDHLTSLGKHEDQGLQGHENIGAPTGLVDHHAAHRQVTAPETHEAKGFDHGISLGEQGHQGLQGHENIGAPTGLQGHHAAHRPVTAPETHVTKGFDHGISLGEQGHQGLQGHENIGAPTGLQGHHAAHRPVTAPETHEAKGFDHGISLGEQGHQGLQGHENIGEPTGLQGHHAAHRPVTAPQGHVTKGFDHGISLGEQGHQGLQGHENIGAPTGLQGHHAAHRPVTAPETHEAKGFDHGISLGEQGHQGLQGHENIGEPTGLQGHHAAHRPVTAPEAHVTKGFDHGTALGLQGHEDIGAPTGLTNQPASHFREQMHRPPTASETHEAEGFDHVTAHGELKDQGLQERKFKVLTSLEEDPHVPKDRPEMNPHPANYQSKVTDPTGANNEKAGVGPLVQSFEKMGVNDVPETTGEQGIEGIRTETRAAGDMELDQGTEHGQYTGSHDQFAPQETPTNFPLVPEDTESVPKSMDPRNPEDLPQDTLTGKPGSYTEKISSATSVIADKAVAAKNVVASKLGYAGTNEETKKTQATEVDKDSTRTNSATGLAQKAASTVAGKLAPVYEKVAGAGSTVMAKVQGTTTGVAGHEGNTKETDKGVSMKEYLAEKFKPGEEDKALSEVISGSLSRQKEKTGETGEAKPMGKVTESEEVERRLGPIGNTMKEENGASGETQVGESFGQGVVDRVKGAVSTWFGKGGEAQTASGITKDSAVGGGAVVGGRVE